MSMKSLLGFMSCFNLKVLPAHSSAFSGTENILLLFICTMTSQCLWRKVICSYQHYQYQNECSSVIWLQMPFKRKGGKNVKNEPLFTNLFQKACQILGTFKYCSNEVCSAYLILDNFAAQQCDRITAMAED